MRSGTAMAHKLEELPIYLKAKEFWSAVNAILDRPRVRKDGDLHDQLSRASDSIPSNMVEGFEQGTDRAFANYLTYSKGSLAEALKWLKKAYFKKYITLDELEGRLAAGEELGKMLGGFIKYLRRCDWKRPRLARRERVAAQRPTTLMHGDWGIQD